MMENQDETKWKIHWGHTVIFTLAHILSLIGLVNIYQGRVLISTVIYTLISSDLACLGITVGAHRLWSHKSFKAKTPLKILLMLCQSTAGQLTIWQWVLWHRVHHIHSDTDADPHNSKRGFFYAHIGWVFLYDEDKFRPYARKINMSDLEKDPVVMWQRKYLPRSRCFLFGWILSTCICYFCFGESLFNGFIVASQLRTIYISHRIWLVNSAAHLWGSRPYDKSMCPTQNKFVSFALVGEGWHNYHHAFPHDYKAAELGLYRWNLGTAVIDFFAWIGWAYDLRSASPEAVQVRVARTGDKSLPESRTFG